jgi:NADPH:quinone reductase-like Zn-dependent oxidoreductase
LITLAQSIIKPMKAAVCDKYGPPEVLELTDVEKPVPGASELLIKVHASSVNAADCNVRGLTYIPPGLGIVAKAMLGFKKPKTRILGSVFSGVIADVGKDTTMFKVGDEVFGTGPEMGGYGEYMVRPEKGAITKKPENISHEEAASVPYGALTALHFLRDMGNIKKSQKVLVIGASGGVGVYAIQLAKYFGAHVSGVCSTGNLEFVKSLGADNVFDYTKEDVTKSGVTWDIITDIVVGKTSFSKYRNSLNPKGYYLAIAGGLGDMLAMVRTSIIGGRKAKFGGGADAEKKENIEFIADLIKKSNLKPVLDKTFLLDEIVEAHKYVESGKKKGNIAISL